MEGESRLFLHLSMSCCQRMLFGIAESTGKVPEARTWIVGPEDQKEFLTIDYKRTTAGFGIAPVLVTAVLTPARRNQVNFRSASHAVPDQSHHHIFAQLLGCVRTSIPADIRIPREGLTEM